MKKNLLKIAFFICGAVLAALLIWKLTDPATVTVDGQSTQVSFAESWQLRAALMADSICFDGAGCPFSTAYSVNIAGLTYCIAQDGCNTIWIKERNIYYTVERKRHQKLEELMLTHWSEKIRPKVSQYTFATFEKKGDVGYKFITSEISKLYTFDSLPLRPAMGWSFEEDWLYRIVLNPDSFTGRKGELEILFGEKNLSLNSKICVPPANVSYEEILNWAAAKFEAFDYEALPE